MIEHLLRTAREAGCDVALLHTSQPHLQAYYARLGFQRLSHKEYFNLTVPQPSVSTNVGDQGAWLSESVSSLSAADFACMQTLHADRIEKFSLSVIRPLEYWRSWIAAEMALPSRQLFLLKGKTIRGYAVVHRAAGTWATPQHA